MRSGDGEFLEGPQNIMNNQMEIGTTMEEVNSRMTDIITQFPFYYLDQNWRLLLFVLNVDGILIPDVDLYT